MTSCCLYESAALMAARLERTAAHGAGNEAQAAADCENRCRGIGSTGCRYAVGMKDLSPESLVGTVGRCLPAMTFAVGFIACTAGRERPALAPVAPRHSGATARCGHQRVPAPDALRAPVPQAVPTATCGAAADV